MNQHKQHEFWAAFIAQNKHYQQHTFPLVDHFCDNQKDADECAQLVLLDLKVATAGALFSYQMEGIPFPKVGDLLLVTNWAKDPICIVETTAINVRRFGDIDEAWARKESEGDKSLGYWRQVHWGFFERELQPYGLHMCEDLLLVCEEFKRVG